MWRNQVRDVRQYIDLEVVDVAFVGKQTISKGIIEELLRLRHERDERREFVGRKTSEEPRDARRDCDAKDRRNSAPDIPA